MRTQEVAASFDYTHPELPGMGPTMKLESILQYVDAYLGIAGFPDYPDAFNGLQVEGPEEITRIAAAVDASEATIASAADQGCDLLIVHHGLFWDGQRTVTGRRFRRLSTLLRNGIALYAAHLPLDAHHEVGNCALLARALGIDIQGGFGAFQGVEVGCMGNASESRESLRDKLAEVVQGEVRLIAGGPEEIERVAVVTGGGGSLIEEAARAGADAFVTGEGAHHTYFDAMEHGVNVYYAGHYATETFGVRALAAHLEERFQLPWIFIDHPTGL